jgi:Fe-S cluster biosynthesis and repair protein YggX
LSGSSICSGGDFRAGELAEGNIAITRGRNIRERVMPRVVQCIKLGREEEGLEFPPYPGALGIRIFEEVSKPAWKAWLEHQKMIVNENRLNLADVKARKYLAEQMERYFFGAGADVPSGFVPPSPPSGK